MNIKTILLVILIFLATGCSQDEQDAAIDRQTERVKERNAQANNTMDEEQANQKDDSGDFNSFNSAPGKRIIDDEDTKKNGEE